MRETFKIGFKINKNNGPVGCTACKEYKSKHKMEQQYLTCKCGVASCALSWKINSCIYSDNWNLFQHGDLHNIEYDTACSTRVLGQKPTKRYGIALCVQKIFYSWLKRNKRMTAFDLRAKLIEKRYKNNQKPNEQQSEKFKLNEQLIPTLVQVCLLLLSIE
jgi:hypothetical protein